MGEFGYELFVCYDLNSPYQQDTFEEIKAFVRVHCFGTMAGIFFIYGDEGHKQNLYKKFNFDSDELRKKIEDIL